MHPLSKGSEDLAGHLRPQGQPESPRHKHSNSLIRKILDDLDKLIVTSLLTAPELFGLT